MASDYRLIRADGVVIYLVNSSGTPLAGGSPYAPATTPFGIDSEWAPIAPAPADGGGDDFLSYAPIDETLTIYYLGTSGSGAATAARLLNEQFTARFNARCVLYARPDGGTAGYYEVYRGLAQPLVWSGTKRGPGEGAANIAIDLTLRRAPFAVDASLTTAINGTSFTNTHTGNVVTLGALTGDMRYAGLPMNIRVDKPASQSPTVLYLATVYSRTADTTSSTASAVTSTTTGTNYTVSGSIDLSALRTRAGLKLRVMARLSTLTNPSKAQLKVTVAAASGGTLWVSPWTTLGSNTTAQLVDLGGIGLDTLRYALSNTSNVTIQATLRSTDGTSVTATLGYVEALLYYDFCKVESGTALGASQRFQLLGAQNLSGAGWHPQVPETAMIVSTADAPIRPVVLRQPLIRAFDGASLYAAWVDANGAHTNTDTTTITASFAPLYRSLRG
jgi:hypothetical protein